MPRPAVDLAKARKVAHDIDLSGRAQNTTPTDSSSSIMGWGAKTGARTDSRAGR